MKTKIIAALKTSIVVLALVVVPYVIGLVVKELGGGGFLCMTENCAAAVLWCLGVVLMLIAAVAVTFSVLIIGPIYCYFLGR